MSELWSQTLQKAQRISGPKSALLLEVSSRTHADDGWRQDKSQHPETACGSQTVMGRGRRPETEPLQHLRQEKSKRTSRKPETETLANRVKNYS